MKLIDARKDHYRKLAHEEGYRSRSSYKLKELHKSYRIIGAGHYVLDLGCAPGGWTQIAVQLAGNQGKVMGVDTSYVEEIPGAHIIKSDISDIILCMSWLQILKMDNLYALLLSKFCKLTTFE